MPITLPLNEMTVAEKLQVMEALWEDLSRNSDVLESPEWNRDVLEDRERRISSGEAKFTDWEQVKAAIRKRVSWRLIAESQSKMDSAPPPKRRTLNSRPGEDGMKLLAEQARRTRFFLDWIE